MRFEIYESFTGKLFLDEKLFSYIYMSIGSNIIKLLTTLGIRYLKNNEI